MAGPADIKALPAASLLCDQANPRIVEEVDSHRDALRSIWKADTDQLLNLAEDIAENGLIPFINLFVAPHKDEGMYLVLEGNRRTAAIKALHSAEVVDDLLTPKQRTRLKKAAKLPNVPQEVNCAVVKDDAAVNMWIQRRHSGQQDGRGLVPWGALQLARFRSRTLGEQHPTLMVMDFVIEKGDLERSVLDGLDRSFSFTNFQRFVDSVLARRLMGIDIERGEDGKRRIRFFGPEEEIVPGWEAVFRLVESKALKVNQIKTVELQIKYLRTLGDDVLPDPEKMEPEYKEVLTEVALKLGLPDPYADAGSGTGDGGGVSGDGDDSDASGGGSAGGDTGTSGGSGNDGTDSTGDGDASTSGDDKGGRGKSGGEDTSSGDAGGASSSRRTKLIPKGHKLNVRPQRVREIYDELQQVPVRKYRNAVAVLLRVFVELSLDVLNDEEDDLRNPPRPQATWNQMKLSQKVDRAIEWLEVQGHLSGDGAKAAKKAFASQPLSESSVTVMNGFVHNQHMFPDAAGLKTAWDNIEPFMTALWNTRPRPLPSASE